MPVQKVLTDKDPETGAITHEGVGSTIGVDVQQAQENALAQQQAITGQLGGFSGHAFGQSASSNAKAVQNASTQQVQSVTFHSDNPTLLALLVEYYAWRARVVQYRMAA